MRVAFLSVLVLHGLIHLLGFTKAFGYAELPQLVQPISRGMGALWLFAAIMMLATAGAVIVLPQVWWVVGGCAVVLSQIAIAASWSDAKFGTLANVLVLLGAVYNFAAEGPLSLRAEYREQVRMRAQNVLSPPVLTASDLSPLPEPIQRYIRQSGAVGAPRVKHFFATWKGRIRGGADEPWMNFTAEQHNFVDEPARLFLMDARRGGLPVDVFHRFTDAVTSMRVRVLSMWTMIEADSMELRQAEVVTIFNDIAILAPSALTNPAITWAPIDANSARGTLTVGAHTARAELIVNAEGELVDFISDDRLAASADGSTFAPRRWSTPLRDYRYFGERRMASHGEARWHMPHGSYAYLELDLVTYRENNPTP